MNRLTINHVVMTMVVVMGSTECAPAAELVGTIVDADTGAALAARVYVQSSNGKWMYVKSTDEHGSAIAYQEQWIPMPQSVERHTTVSAHPFRVDLKPGRYQIAIERGKEFLPLARSVTMKSSPMRETFCLRRWVNMAERGWYSGETHVHRRIGELSNVQLAEDLNVAFPVTFWTIEAYQPPNLNPSPLRGQGPSPFGPREDRGAEMIRIDPTHVIFPRNTEYEIFSVAGKQHLLGAVFILNHRSRFERGMPPVGEIAEQAHREGALLDLDKHNWPWSMMLVPIAKVDLFELSNNSVWRTQFALRRSPTAPAPYMNIETEAGGMTEWGWLDFGFQNYYALLNCGFRLQPTAGTASGVHPVPLGYSRVYVHLDGPFSGEAWLQGLKRGNSFVTTGPMLFAKLNDHHAGHVFIEPSKQAATYQLAGQSLSARPIERIEVLVNGTVQQTLRPACKETAAGAYLADFVVSAMIGETSWIAVRSFEKQPDGRIRFAHTAPWHIDVAGEPIRPHREEVEFLIRRIRDEIHRNTDLLPDATLDEYREALKTYESISRRAR